MSTKEERIFVRVTVDEKEAYRELASKKGLTMSQLIRELIVREISGGNE